jgi:hypothetical protein
MPLAFKSFTIVPTPSNILDGRYPDGDDGEPVIPLSWVTVPSFLQKQEGTPFSVNLFATYLTQPGDLTAVATLASGTLPPGWSLLAAGGLNYSGTGQGSGTIVVRATRGADTADSNSFDLESIAAVTVDTLPPCVPTGLVLTPVGSTQMSVSWDASSDPAPAGTGWSGMKEYTLTRTPGTVKTIASVPGNKPTFSGYDIGAPSSVSVFSQSGADLTIESYGSGIYSTADEGGHYAEQISASEWSLVAKVSSFTHANTYAQAALVARKDATPGSPNVALVLYPFAQNAGLVFQNRSIAGGVTTQIGAVPNTVNPVWLKLTGSGTTYKAYWSLNGNDWVTLGTFVQSLGASPFVGPAVAANGATKPCSVTFQKVALQTLARPTYIDAVAPSTSYSYSLTATDIANNVSAAGASVNGTSGSAAPPSDWPAATPAYVSQIPNSAGFGMDSVFGSGRHLATPATTVYLINTLSTGSVGPTAVPGKGSRVYYCSRSVALAAAGPKFIIPIISGIYDSPSLPALQSAQYCTWAGQIAPSPGFVNINGLINNRGSDGLYWHFTNYINPATNSNADDLGDSLALGGYSTNSGSRNIAANCSLYGATDETLQFYCIGSNYTVWQCHIGNPISISGRDRTTPHGTGILVADDAQNVSILRTIIQHCNFRMPFVRARSLTVANCLMYNAGPTNVAGKTKYGSWFVIDTPGEANQSIESPGTLFQSFVNAEENLFVMGPSAANGGVVPYPIQLNSTSSAVPFVAGSQGYFSGNRKRDRNAAQGQGATLFTNGNSSTPQTNAIQAPMTLPSGYYQASRITSVYPTGYNTYTITDTEAGKLAFAQLMADTVGARPLDRAGWDTFSTQQAANYISGKTGAINVGVILDGTGTVTPTSAYGGYPSVASNTIDPFDSGAMGGDPLITVAAGRDALQPSGLTWLEEWLQRWHFRVAPY